MNLSLPNIIYGENMKRPELLSPAGNFEKMKAAILYGADAVYLAGRRFGMRAAADNFSLEELEAMGLRPEVVTRDLHASEYAEGNVVTEYEAAFSAQGVKINMLRVMKPAGFSAEISPELKKDRIEYNRR